MAKLYLSAVGAEFGTYRQQLRHRLLLEGHSVRTWDDLTPDPDRLKACLRECDAIIFLTGDRFGPECPSHTPLSSGETGALRRSLAQSEFLLARSLGKRILAFLPAGPQVLRDTANDEPDELRKLQQDFLTSGIAIPEGSRATFTCPENLTEQVLAALAVQNTTSAAQPLRLPASEPFRPACPYPGLRPFEEGESALFFGRRRLVEELLTQLEFQPMVLLLGSSGCGKTSVVRAGVIPRWREKYPGGKVLLARPGPNPFEGLAAGADEFPQGVGTGLRQPSSQVFRHLLPSASAPAKPSPSRHILVAIDSLEDLFTRAGDEAEALRRQFLDALIDLVRLPGSGIQVLLALRDDFMPNLRGHDDFYRVADNSLQRITSLKGDALLESIEGPARARGVGFEEGLTAELRREVEARDGMLVLLQDALSTWWREEDLKERRLRRATLERIGGVSGALPQRLTRWFQSLPPADQDATRHLLLSLIEWLPGPEGIVPIPGSATRSRLTSGGSSKLVEALLEQRLLISRQSPASPDSLLELPHESVLPAWPVLKTWIEEMRSAAAILQSLQANSQAWSQAKGAGKRKLCWKGYRLEQALERQQSGDFARLGGLDPRETRFLQSCTRAKAIRSFRDRALSLAVGLVAVVSVGAALLNIVKFQAANSEKHAAEIKAGLGWLARAQSAEGSTDAGFFAAFATGFEGAGREDPSSARELSQHPALAVLGKHRRDPYPRYLSLQETPGRKIEADRRMASAPKPFVWSAPFDPNDGPVETVAFSLDGRRLASGGGNGRVHLWSVATGALERTLNGSTSPVQDLDFSPAGTVLASGHADGTLVLWEVASGQKIASFQGHTGSVRGVAFSPAGTQVASAGDDGTIKLWKVETAGDTRTLAGHSGPVHCLAFGPGGVLLASGGRDRSVRVWDVARGEEVNILSGHMNAVETLAFSPSGRELASASHDQPVIFWDLATNKSQSNLLLPASALSLAFSPDGAHLAVAGKDGQLRLCALGQDRSIRVFSGHSGSLRSLAFSPDGKTIATGSDDRTVKLWAVRDAWKNPPQPLGEASPGNRTEPGASDGFDWLRYVREGWVSYDEHSSVLVWKQLPGGLSYSEQNLPPNSWAGVLRRASGEEQTRQLLTLALQARNWDTAALLRKELPDGPETAKCTAVDSETANVLLLRVRDDLEAGRTAVAEWRMQQGDILFGGEPGWAAMRGEYLERQGDPNAALTCYRQVNAPNGWQAVARLSPDGKEALEAWRKLLQAETKPTPALYLAAGKRAAESHDANAVREFFAAGIQKFPSERNLKTTYACALVELGALDEALSQFESLAAGATGEPDRELVAVLEETKSLNPVLQLLADKTSALKVSGPHATALESLQRLARLYQAAGRLDDAVLVLKDRITYQQEIGQSGSLSASLQDLSKALTQGRRRDEALTVMRARVDLLKTQPQSPELAPALLELQMALSAAGLSGEAVSVIQERIAVQKSQAGAPISDLLSELVTALRKANRQNEALPVLEERVAALQAEGKDCIPAMRELATALQDAGKTAEAWTAYRKITDLPGVTVPMLADVAYWGTLHGNRNDAAALFEQAASRAENDADRVWVIRRRGWAHLAQGAAEDAFLLLGQAKAQLESSPESAKLIESEFLSGLAAAMWLTNRKGASIDEYEALWKRQGTREHWEDPEFIRSRDLPEAGRKVLLELQATWRERLHSAPPPRQ